MWVQLPMSVLGGWDFYTAVVEIKVQACAGRNAFLADLVWNTEKKQTIASSPNSGHYPDDQAISCPGTVLLLPQS